ncbi:MAG TPA: Ig-like domain-containing protein, partial [Phycisphaerae bacterium]|nr:Ig-like domain-containing protein [Phycisphaerae bacterium]
GWTLDGGTGDFCWQWGVPTGQGGDPGRAFTGDSVMGYNLNGTYADNMDSAQYATTPAFDCSAASFVTLSFRRWLGVESDDWDHAAIQVSADGGPWVTVWSNGETGVDDWAWTGQDLDITSVAAGSASVRIRWGMGPTDSSETYGGWNIDDVVVTGSSGRAVIYSEDMADDPGWELDEGTEVGGWEWGIPSGNAGDPDSGYTGDHVIGFNLDGAYPDNLYDPLYGTTPAFDCSDALVVTLRYWRWLGVEDDEWDQATIEVSADGGPWIAVWSNGADAISDTAWVPETVDISAEASFSSSVRIRWGMGPTDGLVTYGGWNIDDVVVTDGVTFDVLYSAYMSDDPQWTLESGQGRYSWQWGRPLGGDDPDSGATGDTVMGYNLGGPYPDNMPAAEYATSPAFDCSGYSGLTLTFQRWLGVENNEWDHATVEASANGGPWVVVWSNGTGTITDSSWTSQSVDISAVADGQASVRLRWGMGPTDTSVTYCGWNIDDVLVVGRQAGPSVFTHSPFADVEAGLDHLDVTFASPIDETTFDEARVTLTGPSGAPVTLTGLGHLSGSTYRVQFDALAELGTYTLRVGPGVTDDNGNPMDQDGDGTLGEESDDVYVGTFAVVPPDTTGPRVDSHSPAGQVAEAQGALRLHFDEPMDTTSFGLDDIAAFTGPGGDLMPAIYGFLWLDPRTLEIRFDWQGASGDYLLTVGPDLRDDCPGGNRMDQDADGVQGGAGDTYSAGFTIRRVDLAPVSLAADPVNLYPVAGAVSVDLAVRNSGTDASGPFEVGFYLSEDPFVGPADLPVPLAGGSATWSVPALGAGEVLADTVALAAPATDPFGSGNDYYLLMVLDEADAVFETNETNNADQGLGVDRVVVYYFNDTDGPRVSAASPDGETASPVSVLAITFSEAIDPDSFSAAEDVERFTGPGGADLLGEVTEWVWLNSRTLEVRFPLQRLPGAYELVIGPDVLDLSGNPMDQDADGAGGEVPDDAFLAAFVIRNPAAPTVELLWPGVDEVCLAHTASLLVLAANVTDDGVGGPDGLTFGWIVQDAPAGSTVVFEDPASAETVVSFSDEGTYELAMAASDGDLSTLAAITVVVGDDGWTGNVAPQTFAGTYKVAGDTMAVLRGTVIDDGNPPSAPVTCGWVQLSGPGVTTFTHPSAAVTGISVSEMGVYVYRLTADDGQVRTADDVTMVMALDGDANLDGVVGIADLAQLADHYGQSPAGWGEGDFNGDGEVGIADLVALADHYGDHAAGEAAAGGLGRQGVEASSDALEPAGAATRWPDAAPSSPWRGLRPAPAPLADVAAGPRSGRDRIPHEPGLARGHGADAPWRAARRPQPDLAPDPTIDILAGLLPVRRP